LAKKKFVRIANIRKQSLKEREKLNQVPFYAKLDQTKPALLRRRGNTNSGSRCEIIQKNQKRCNRKMAKKPSTNSRRCEGVEI